MHVVHNIADAEQLALRGGGAQTAPGTAPDRYLLAAGKLTATKGFDTLIDDLAGGAALPLVIAGAGPREQDLRTRAARLGLEVRFLGWLDGGALIPWIREASAVVLPSRWEEPMSRVMLEAMTLGTPVIAGAGASAAEVIESGRDGWIAEDSGQLHAAVAEAADPARAAAVGAAAAARARELFAPDAVYPLLMDVYAGALDEVRGE